MLTSQSEHTKKIIFKMSDVYESSVFSSSDTDLEENETELNTGCYNHEPKYTKDELAK